MIYRLGVETKAASVIIYMSVSSKTSARGRPKASVSVYS